MITPVFLTVENILESWNRVEKEIRVWVVSPHCCQMKRLRKRLASLNNEIHKDVHKCMFSVSHDEGVGPPERGGCTVKLASSPSVLDLDARLSFFWVRRESSVCLGTDRGWTCRSLRTAHFCDHEIEFDRRNDHVPKPHFLERDGIQKS
jgi:hypothetical protein